jgi:signal transduction histidine kinase
MTAQLVHLPPTIGSLGLVEGHPHPDDGVMPVDTTLRRVVILYRLLGVCWMSILVVMTLAGDEAANRVVVIAAWILAIAWTGMTAWAARDHDRLSSTAFVLADGIVALSVGAASTVSGAEDLFHGGYPMTWLAVAAYAWGLRGALISSFFLAAEQVVVHQVDGRGLIPAAGSVTFIVLAVVLGWSFDALRDRDRQRLEMAAQLDEALAAEVRHEERAELANRLHDSVLQTLVVLRREADDPAQVRYLARRQERELRHTIDEYRSPHEESARAAVLAICGDIEDLYRLEVDAVIRGDAEVDERLTALLGAAREALANAAKYAGVDRLDLYADLSAGSSEIYVRDRGCGFDAASIDGRGLVHSIEDRLQAVGGSSQVITSPGAGTEIRLFTGQSK